MSDYFVKHGGIILLNLILIFNFTLMIIAKKYFVLPTFLFILLIDIIYVAGFHKFGKKK